MLRRGNRYTVNRVTFVSCHKFAFDEIQVGEPAIIDHRHLGQDRFAAPRMVALGFGNSPSDLCSGDLAKCNHDIPVVRDNQRLGAFLKLPRPF